MYSLTDTEILMRARTAASVLRHLGRSLCSVPFKHEVLSLLQAIHLLLAFYLVRVRSDFFTQFISQRYGVIIFYTDAYMNVCPLIHLFVDGHRLSLKEK